MENNLISIGILVILVGFALVFIGALTSLGSGQKDTKVAVGGFIGFIPFGFGNDKRLVWALVVMMALVMIFFFAMNFFMQRGFK